MLEAKCAPKDIPLFEHRLLNADHSETPMSSKEPLSIKERVNILLVDDQPAKLLTYEVMLHELDENLIKSTSAREALGMLLRMEFAVVLLDVSMPEIDGFELARMIRQHPRFEKTAIIFVSALHVTDLDRLKGYEMGAADYISVPVVAELLRAKVSVFVDLHRKAKEMDNLNAQLHQVSSRLMRVQDEERRRIARELHDGLGQELGAIKLMLAQMVEEKSASSKDSLALEGSDLVDRAIQQVRTMSYLLHPPLLDEVGLASALRCYLDGVTKRSKIEISLDIQPPQFPRLSRNVETTIFRIVQEALTNVFRHSKASRSWVILSEEERGVLVMVRDDGKGLPKDILELRPDSVGVGLEGMRQRCKELGGQFRISNAHPGTLLEVLIPRSSAHITHTGAHV
jgi:signal transduction histidine kinase